MGEHPVKYRRESCACWTDLAIIDVTETLNRPSKCFLIFMIWIMDRDDKKILNGRYGR